MRRVLHRPRPDVHVTLLIVAAVEGEGVLLGPGADDQVVRLQITFPQHRRVLAIGVAGVHGRADRETRDQTSARNAVDHREFFRDARRRIVERERIAHHAQSGVRRAPRQRCGDQIRRRHQAITVGVMLIHAYRVEAAFRRVFQLVHEIVVHQMRALWIEQRRMDIDPHRRVLRAEIVGQFGVRHQVEPHEFHARSPRFVAGRALTAV